MDWKLRKTYEKHAGRSTLLYELNLKAANVEQTNTHTHKVSTVTLVRMRRALINNDRDMIIVIVVLNSHDIFDYQIHNWFCLCGILLT